MAYNICAGHKKLITDLCYSPDNCGGSLLLSASMDSRTILRDGENGDWIRTFASPEKTSPVKSCSLTTATHLRAATASHYNASVWDVETGRLLHVIESRKSVKSCDFSKNGKKLLIGGLGNTFRIFDLDHPDGYPEILLEPKKRQHQLVYSAAWLEDERFILASCDLESGARIWDRRSGNVCATLDTESSVSSSEANQDCITIASGSTVSFWDASEFRCSLRYKMPCFVQSASLYGNKFIAGGEDGHVYLFDLHTGRKIKQYYFGDNGGVVCVRFSPDGKSFASGFDDGTVIINKL